MPAARDLAFQAFSQRGAYNVTTLDTRRSMREQIAVFLNETVVHRGVRHDLGMGPRGQKRDEHLLEEIFRLACRYIGQSPGQTLYWTKSAEL